ncbi:MAG: carbohydrate binding family 9 domain-containing protein [Candidatus Coatesbacteria bacterium]|nr:MAG: carbohydrate binding family 9 domain-containing protein [Candidatus Coatesbacteria bacterium]
MFRTWLPLILLALLVAAGGAGGEEWVITAARVETPPVVDGVWEEVWHQAEPAKGFRQFRPEFGAPAEADTDVYFLYDNRALYVGWVCYEPDVEHLVATASVHDMILNYDDCVDLFWDANNDRNTCYDLMANYCGVKYEGIGYRGGQDWDAGWDGPWEAKTSVGEGAWYVEMAIPWASVRYDRKASSFGVQLSRYRITHYENTFWAGEDVSISRVASYGRLEGFEDLPRPRPFQFTPYATARAEDRNATPAYNYEPTDGWEFEPRAGFDFRYRAGAAAQALLTFLPDYAYIEADPAQVNLQPTEIWFPEKRPFFAEHAELFATTVPPLYTRRLTEIGGGAKVTGKAGEVSFGAFDVALKKDDPRFPGDNVWAARARAELPHRSSVGVIGVGRRELDGLAAEPPYAGGDAAVYNNVLGADGRLGLPLGLDFDAGYLKSGTAGAGGDGACYYGMLTRPGSIQFATVYFVEVGEEFRADAGFLQPEQLGTRTAAAVGHHEFQINRGGVRSLNLHGHFEHDWNLEAETLRNFFYPEVGVNFTNKLGLGVAFEGGRDLRYVRYGYPAFRLERYEVSLRHDTCSWGSAGVAYWQGEYYGEYYHDYGAEVTLLPFARFVLKADGEVAVPAAGDRSVAGNVNATYNFTDELYWRVLVRADSASRTGLASTLWGWNYRPGSTAYLAYEQRRDASGHFLLAEQLLFLKVSYMIGF